MKTTRLSKQRKEVIGEIGLTMTFLNDDDQYHWYLSLARLGIGTCPLKLLRAYLKELVEFIAANY